MQIIIPMTGRSQRFLQAGYTKPKQLISVDGKPMIAHAVDLFPGENDVLFICNEEHAKTTNQTEILKTLRPNSTIINLPLDGKGPVSAIQQAFAYIKDDEPVMISYCDYGGQWDYAAFKKIVASGEYDGAVPAYTGFHPHLLHKKLYAGIIRDNNDDMQDIREKHCFTPDNPQASLHSAGAYYFKSGALLKKYVNELIAADINLNGEYYASMLYYLLLRDKKRVLVPEMTHFLQLGTPEDLEEYEAWSRLLHQELGLAKGSTEIPVEREKLVAVPYEKNSDNYQQGFNYWKHYFTNYD